MRGDSARQTAKPLRVGAALPDPPFEFMGETGPLGFDVDLMRPVAEALGRTWKLVRFEGQDFAGIFAGLKTGLHDCVASGTTITPERAETADFCEPYVMSGQSLVVDIGRHAQVRSTADLAGLTIGVQQGNTSGPVAERPAAKGHVGCVRHYAYHDIDAVLDDLSSGGCDAFMKLAPVTQWLVRDRPRLRVVATGITKELLGVCVRKGDTGLRAAIDEAQRRLRADGTLQRLVDRWLGDGASVAGGAP
ncbi:MAG: ABC transporter substrate-binding protein [Rhodospirillales bacterium]|nr:ABC transporter substrate-binding protein [Rhodospirillales bacterium]